MTGPTTIGIVIADDHPLMLAGLSAQLDAEPDIEVLATADSGKALIAAFSEHRPAVVVTDVAMPDGGGFGALSGILSLDAKARVLMLSAVGDGERVAQAMTSGAAGYLVKDITPAGLADAIRRVAAGETVLDPRSTGAAFTALRAGRQALTPLSDREREVLARVAQGRSNAEIAAELLIAASTVKTHLERVFTKLDVSDRAAAVARAKDLGII